MLNDFHGPDGRTDSKRGSDGQQSSEAPLSDREVPLNPRSTPAVVHAWLDGEVSMADAMRGDSGRDVEFWNRINDEAEARRHMRTPVHVQQRIMEAIPKNATAATESGWLQRQPHLTNGALIMIGAAILAAGVAAVIILS